MQLKSSFLIRIKTTIQLSIFLLISLLSIGCFGQVEFTTWGNITGIRVDKQLMEFSTCLVVIDTNLVERITALEKQKMYFKRENDIKIFNFEMDSLIFNQTIKSPDKGKAELNIDFYSKVDTIIHGAYLRLNFPRVLNETITIKIKENENSESIDFSTEKKDSVYTKSAKNIKIISNGKQLEIDLSTSTKIILKRKSSTEFEINFLIASDTILSKTKFSNTFNIAAKGDIDTTPVNIKLFPLQAGKPFDGIGGNFRLQNPNVDPKVIDYCLENLRVTWSRVEMPWMLWHPDLDKDPIEEAKKGNLHPNVKAALEMAQKLDKKGIPVILAAWYGPDWAIIGKRAKDENPDGTRGNPLDLTKKEAIYKSIISYIKYLKEAYGVEAVMFSFNEADLGIEIRQTEKEHNDFIKGLGTVLKSEGIKTKLLLGDTADATGWKFTTLGSTDPESQPYIGSVSFHSWRGWTNENLLKWRDISNRVNKPLLVGEGSIDAGAWRYPQILEEPTYALDEIEVYIKILNIAQPKSILQWQLTSDYSLLSGGGVFGNTDKELHPTQRFYNLKQLGDIPKNLFAIPVTSNNNSITCAALGNVKKGKYVIHIVNKGASRKAIFTGIPSKVKKLNVFVTNTETPNVKTEIVSVINGSCSLIIEGASFITLRTK